MISFFKDFSTHRTDFRFYTHTEKQGATLTCRERKVFIAVEMELSLQRERLESIDEELPAESRNLMFERMKQQQFAEDDGPVSDHRIKLKIQTQTQTLEEDKH